MLRSCQRGVEASVEGVVLFLHLVVVGLHGLGGEDACPGARLRAGVRVGPPLEHDVAGRAFEGEDLAGGGGALEGACDGVVLPLPVHDGVEGLSLVADARRLKISGGSHPSTMLFSTSCLKSDSVDCTPAWCL